jgi:pyrophosphatase PpaX
VVFPAMAISDLLCRITKRLLLTKLYIAILRIHFMKIKAIFMDLDGTLIDSIPLITKSVEQTINHFNFKCSKQKLRKLSQLHSRDIAYYFIDKNKTTFNPQDFVEHRRKTFLKLLEKKQKQWFKDAKPFIKKMSKKYKLAIVTGSRWIFIDAVFDAGTKNKLEAIITSDDVKHKKPDIEPLEKALGKVRAKKSEVIFIGDSTQDALMCQRFGISFIGKTTGISTKFQLKKFKSVLIANNFKEIERFISNQ